MKLTQDEYWDQWMKDRLDPDNWFTIPEFGVKPADVDFHGFQGAIVTATEENREANIEIRSMVKSARAFAQQVFVTHQEALQANLDFLYAVENEGYQPTLRDAAAFRYSSLMFTLERLFGAHKTPAQQLRDIAYAGASLGDLGQVAADIKQGQHLDTVEASIRAAEILAKFKKGGAA